MNGKMSTIRYPIAIELDREDDGRWIAEATASPGVMAYGSTAGMAVEACLGLLADMWVVREEPEKCLGSRAPLGWWCSRDRDHPGPCAARLIPDFLAWAAQVGSPPTSGMASADPLPDFCQDCGQHGPHLCPGHHPLAHYLPSEEGE